MKYVITNEIEFEKLSGLPHLAFRVYMVMRWRMDVNTFLVGDTVRFSRRALMEWCEVDKVSGRHASCAGQPTEKQIRGTLELLESEGLISRPRGPDQFVFLFDLALAGKPRPKKEGPGKGRRMGRENAPQSQSQHGPVDNLGPGVLSRKGLHKKEEVNPVYEINAAAALRAVEEKTGMLLPHEITSWLCKAEQARGKSVMVSVEDALIKSWSIERVRADVLVEAHGLAVVDRVIRDNPAAVNPGFLNVFIGKLQGQGGAVSPWFKSASGIEGKGSELGLHQSPGEHFQIFKARVFVAAGMTDDEARRWQA